MVRGWGGGRSRQISLASVGCCGGLGFWGGGGVWSVGGGWVFGGKRWGGVGVLLPREGAFRWNEQRRKRELYCATL